MNFSVDAQKIEGEELPIFKYFFPICLEIGMTKIGIHCQSMFKIFQTLIIVHSHNHLLILKLLLINNFNISDKYFSVKNLQFNINMNIPILDSNNISIKWKHSTFQMADLSIRTI